MAEESDGIDEAIEGQIRLLISAAGQLGERIARAREEAQRKVQSHSEQQAREFQTRLAAERLAARAELNVVHHREWWDEATPDQIGRAYQVAQAWRQEDPEAERASLRIKDELRSRYNIDADRTGADPAAVKEMLDRAEQDRSNTDSEHTRAETERLEAQRLATQAEQEDQRAAEARAAAQFEPDPVERVRAAADAEQSEAQAEHAREGGDRLYDSAERRTDTAQNLESKGIDRDVVATRMRADVSQGKPATEAVNAKGKKQTSRAGGRGRGQGRQSQAQRTGLSR